MLRQNLHQIQLARLLEVPIEELERRIEEEIERNDALELQETSLILPDEPILQVSARPASEGLEADAWDPAGSSLLDSAEAPEEYYGPYNYAAPRSLYEALQEQLATLELTPRERSIAEFLVGNLDERGFLPVALARLARSLSAELPGPPVTPEEVESVLQKIQTLEPPGIAARNLQECLLLQARALPENDPTKPYLLRLLTHDFALLEQGKVERLKKLYQLDESQWEALLQKLRSFSLAPANALSEETAPQVTPDFILRIEPDGTLRVELVRLRPIRLRVNPTYKKLLERYAKKSLTKEEAEVVRYIKEKVEKAEQFIHLLRQREQTLLRTAEEIVRNQRPFFLNGCNEKYLRPLVLRNIAEATKLNISTISRVVNSKHIQTPCGIYPLKFFFSEGLPTQEGRTISNKAIKSLIRELISQEDPTRPYSDAQLAKLLAERGIQIKRRTLAKYREQLGIPIARDRYRFA
ncbi:MAG: RNA polymerase factor sigma-54 [Bacteroidia bacterium]